jgi:UDP-glucose 6-dehydrogenase
MRPDRVVIGSRDEAIAIMKICTGHVFTRGAFEYVRSRGATKYAANAFLLPRSHSSMRLRISAKRL